jgi:hypothetical protein
MHFQEPEQFFPIVNAYHKPNTGQNKKETRRSHPFLLYSLRFKLFLEVLSPSLY